MPKRVLPLVIALSLACVLTSLAQLRIERHAGRQGWIARQTRSETSIDGIKHITEKLTYYFDGKGFCRLLSETFYYGGRSKNTSEQLITVVGFLNRSSGEEKYIFGGPQTGYLHDSDTDPRNTKQDPDYLRDEMVGRWKCFVYRVEKENPQLTGELFFAYNLGGFRLKGEIKSPTGTFNTETESIEIGPVSSELIDFRYDWPIDYSRYEQEMLDKQSKYPIAANDMKKAIEEAKTYFEQYRQSARKSF